MTNTFPRDTSCTACPLSDGATNVCIDGEGPLTAELLIIGISPGRQADRDNKPFGGPSEELLKSVLAENQLIARLTNVVRCRAPETRDPNTREIQACSQYLSYEIGCMTNLRVVVCLGSIPMKSVGLQGAATELAGVPCKSTMPAYKNSSLIFVPIMHPAGVIRRQTYLSTWESHWHQIRNLVNPPTESFADRVGATLFPDGLQGRYWRTL